MSGLSLRQFEIGVYDPNRPHAGHSSRSTSGWAEPGSRNPSEQWAALERAGHGGCELVESAFLMERLGHGLVREQQKRISMQIPWLIMFTLKPFILELPPILRSSDVVTWPKHVSQSLQQIKAQAVLMGTHTLGWVAIVVATFSYGSLFVPVKNYDIHDGIVYQWFQCCGILLAGLLQALWRNDWEAPGLSAPGFYVCREGVLVGGLEHFYFPIYC